MRAGGAFSAGGRPPGTGTVPSSSARRQKGPGVEPALLALAFDQRGNARGPEELRQVLARLQQADAAYLEVGLRYSWRLWARPKQVEPAGPWRWWFLCCGRGFGKTRTAAETTNARVIRLGELQARDRRPRRVGLVGRDATAVREEMIEGPEGILACSPPWMRPEWEPSKKRLTWPNGVVGRTFTADEPDGLRGPNLYWMWLEEVSSWRYPEAFHEGANLCLRKGDAQGIITSTPKRVPLIKDFLLGFEDPATHQRPGAPLPDFAITRGSTYENAPNLSKGFIDSLLARYEGTNTGRQELHGELLEDVTGALWTYDVIEKNRVREHPPLVVVAVAVDPTRAESGQGDECGIVAGGLGTDGHVYVLSDDTLRGSPETWGRAALRRYNELRADHLTWESNFAKDLVPRVLLSIDPNARLREVTATRGKVVRAEPVAGLYEQGRVHHVLRDATNPLARLEDELCGWSPGQQVRQERSPNRLDAMVWLVTDLALSGHVQIAAPMSIGTRPSNWR